MNILLPMCMNETYCDKLCCDIKVVAIRVTKERQWGHLTPWDNDNMCTCNNAATTTV